MAEPSPTEPSRTRPRSVDSPQLAVDTAVATTHGAGLPSATKKHRQHASVVKAKATVRGFESLRIYFASEGDYPHELRKSDNLLDLYLSFVRVAVKGIDDVPVGHSARPMTHGSPSINAADHSPSTRAFRRLQEKTGLSSTACPTRTSRSGEVLDGVRLACHGPPDH